MKTKPLLAKTRKLINKAVCGAAPGFFYDEYWHGLSMIKAALDRACRAKSYPGKCLEDYDLVWDIEADGYTHGEDGEPTGKNWTFTVIDEDGRQSQGIIRASFCGSVNDPSSCYDMVAYMT